jgi:nucleotide-binding universal stress UspA family protein
MSRVIACIDASPCVNATAAAAAWVAGKTGRELILLQVLDYSPASYHLGEISGVIGFESNAMLLKELAELDEKQFELAQKYSDDLLKHISAYIEQEFSLQAKILQLRGDFLEQCFEALHSNDIVVIGKVGEHAAESAKPVGSNVEGLIRGVKATVLTVGEVFSIPTSFLFAYEYSQVCQDMLKRIAKSDLLHGLTCHLVYVGDQNGILDQAIQSLSAAGIEVQAEYIYGEVAQSLLDYQQQHQTGLMVMGAFSHSKLHQFFLGSTTLKIFKRSTQPMLVVR